MKSHLEVYDLEKEQRVRLHTFERIVEAPNWLRDGDTILYNSEGRIWKYSISKKREWPVDTGRCCFCNNDHVPSPDNQYLAISSGLHSGDWNSHIYVLPIGGGEPMQITANAPSFLHGWSEDGYLAYCAFRNEEGKFGQQIDIYEISAQGGKEKRLTDGLGYNDGAEYAMEGRHIWFNSTRSGLMQIFRMDRDGRNLTQITYSRSNNWFPHVSPDNSKVVYLTFREEDLKPEEHLPDKQVEIWCMNYDGTEQRCIVQLFGGQGTINVNSWSPDGKRFAFVSYE